MFRSLCREIHKRAMTPVLTVAEFERVSYADALGWQRRAVELRQAGQLGDVLFLLEHAPVVTLGRNADPAHLLSSPDQLRSAGVEVSACDRGGDVTYHGPGQLVGYPIVDLRACPRPQTAPAASGRVVGLGPVDYVRALEEVLIGVAGDFGVPCRRIPKLTGVWTVREPARKLAAIGIHVSRGVTSHGFALNVSTALTGFAHIVPCGISDRGVTSLAEELGQPPALEQVRCRVLHHFARVFAWQVLRLPAGELPFASPSAAWPPDEPASSSRPTCAAPDDVPLLSGRAAPVPAQPTAPAFISD